MSRFPTADELFANSTAGGNDQAQGGSNILPSPNDLFGPKSRDFDAPVPQEQTTPEPKKLSTGDYIMQTDANLRKYGQAAFKYGVGALETGAQMTTSFVGAVPGFLEGLNKALLYGDVDKFAEEFKKVQEAWTYEPKTEKGKEVSGALGNLFEKYSGLVDKYLVEPNLENKNILLATIGKTAGEAIPLLLPFHDLGKAPVPREGNRYRTPEEVVHEGELIRPGEPGYKEPSPTVGTEGRIGAEQPAPKGPIEGEVVPNPKLPAPEALFSEEQATTPPGGKAEQAAPAQTALESPTPFPKETTDPLEQRYNELHVAVRDGIEKGLDYHGNALNIGGMSELHNIMVERPDVEALRARLEELDNEIADQHSRNIPADYLLGAKRELELQINRMEPTKEKPSMSAQDEADLAALLQDEAGVSTIEETPTSKAPVLAENRSWKQISSKEHRLEINNRSAHITKDGSGRFNLAIDDKHVKDYASLAQAKIVAEDTLTAEPTSVSTKKTVAPQYPPEWGKVEAGHYESRRVPGLKIQKLQDTGKWHVIHPHTGLAVDTFSTLREAKDYYANSIPTDWVNENVPLGQRMRSQRGSLDFNAIHEGVQDVFKKIDESALMHQVRVGTQPLEALDPHLAASVKQFFSYIEMAKATEMDELREVSRFSQDELELMHRAIEEPEVMRQLNERQQYIVKKNIKEMNQLGEAAKALGVIAGIKQPYAQHVVKAWLKLKPDEARKIFGNSILRSYLKTKKRKYATFKEGEAAGHEYLLDYRMQIRAKRRLQEAIFGKQFVRSLQSMVSDEGVPILSQPGEALPNYVTFPHPAFTTTVYNSSKHINWKGKKYYLDKNGEVNIEGKVYKSQAGQLILDNAVRKIHTTQTATNLFSMIHQDFAGPLKEVLEAKTPHIAYMGLMKAKAASMGFIMYNPIFHNMTVFTKMIPTLPWAGMKMITNPKSVIGDIYDLLPRHVKASLATPAGPYMLGHWLGKNHALKMEAIEHGARGAIVNAGRTADPRKYWHEAKVQSRGYQQDLYGEIDPLRDSVIERFTPLLGDFLKRMGGFWHDYLLWDRVGDLQLGLYWIYKNKYYAKAKGRIEGRTGQTLTQGERLQLHKESMHLAGEMSNYIVGMFGREDFNRLYSAFLNTALFSRSYTMSTVRLMKQGVRSMPRHLQGQMIMMREEGKLTNDAFKNAARATLIKDALLFAVSSAAINYIMTGLNDIPDENGNRGAHWPWQNEPGKKWHIAVAVDNNNRVTYIGNPFRFARDIVESVVDTGKVIRNKLSPLAHFTSDFVSQRDWKGERVVPESHHGWAALHDWGKHLVKTLTGYENFMDTAFPNQGDENNYWRFSGVQVSRGHYAGPNAGSLAEIAREQAGIKKQVLAEAAILMKKGEKAKADQLMNDNKISPESQLDFILKQNSPDAYFLLNLKYAEMLRVATPEQLERLKKIRLVIPRSKK